LTTSLGGLDDGASAPGAGGTGDDGAANDPGEAVIVMMALTDAPSSDAPSSADGGADSGAHDGGAPLPRDAAPDTFAPDTGAVDSAMPDTGAPDTGGTGGVDWCIAHPGHTVCSDFDTSIVASNQGNWALTTLGVSTAALDTSEFVSSPSSFHVVTPSQSGAGYTGAYLAATLYQTKHTVTYAFDLRINSCSAPPPAGIEYLAFSVDGGRTQGQLYILPSGQYSFNEATQTSLTQHPFTAHPTLGVWTHVSITATYARLTSSSSVTVSFDSMALLNTKLTTPVTPSGMVILNFGWETEGAFGGCDVEFDDLTIDLQ
jgi:hypothetical protein